MEGDKGQWKGEDRKYTGEPHSETGRRKKGRRMKVSER
jgi:hypothetical protein